MIVLHETNPRVAISPLNPSTSLQSKEESETFPVTSVRNSWVPHKGEFFSLGKHDGAEF